MLTGAAVLRALAASCLRGAFPPVDLRAVCFVRAIVDDVLDVVVGGGVAAVADAAKAG